MAGAGIRYDISTVERLAERFDDMAARGADTTPLMDEIGASIELSIDRRFELERDPEGNPWAPTIKGYSILKGSPSRLRSSFTRDAGPRRVEVGTSVPYAGVHQDGATIVPRNGNFLVFKIGERTIFAKSVTIPARPFIGLNEADRTEISEIVLDWHRDLVEGTLQ